MKKSLITMMGLLLLCAACKNSTDGGEKSSNATMHIAGAGSTFTFQEWSTIYDGGGPVGRTGPVKYFTSRVFQTGETYEGRNNVSEIISGTDTTWINYEQDGDLSVYEVGPAYAIGPGMFEDHHYSSGRWYMRGWVTLPIFTKSESSLSAFDSIGVDTVALKEMYIGNESLTLANHTFDAIKISEAIQDPLDDPLEPTGTSVVYWISQETGLIVMRTEQSIYRGTQNGTDTTILTSYTVK